MAYIIKPLVSEKANGITEKLNQFSFLVRPSCSNSNVQNFHLQIRIIQRLHRIAIEPFFSKNILPVSFCNFLTDIDRNLALQKFLSPCDRHYRFTSKKGIVFSNGRYLYIVVDIPAFFRKSSALSTCSNRQVHIYTSLDHSLGSIPASRSYKTYASYKYSFYAVP